jgi:hypothetical protein
MVTHVSKENIILIFKGSMHIPENQNPGYPTILMNRTNLGRNNATLYLSLIPSSKNGPH